MNKQSKKGIEWCTHTWTPLVGCKRGCSYCYGKTLNNRFGWIKDWEEPQFYPERLIEPSKLKKPSTIFVCSMAELFGSWVPDAYIHQIIEVAIACSQHQFMFLTKNPRKMRKFIFPDNAWVGITIEDQKAANERTKWFKPNYAKHKFISFEPLLGPVDVDLTGIDLVIIGAQTKPDKIPAAEWVERLCEKAMMANARICLKSNLKESAKSIAAQVKVYNDTKTLIGR